MLRSTLIGAGAALLCATSFAQQQIDPSELFPVTAPVQHAGVFNLSNHRWMSPSKAAQFRGTTFLIYNNTCTWTGANFYFQGAYVVPCIDCAVLTTSLYKMARGGTAFSPTAATLTSSARTGIQPRDRLSPGGARCARAP